MNKRMAGCLVLWLGTAVWGLAQDEAVACDADTMAQVLKRLAAIEERLDEIDNRFGKHLPGSESVSNIYNDVKKIKNEVRDVSRNVERVSSDLRRLESRR